MLLINRGLPGSGKTSLALSLTSKIHPSDHFEADQFFYDENGENYSYDPKKIGEAHAWCQRQVETALKYSNDSHLVIVANTFTRLWEMQPYIDMAKKYDHTFFVVTCEGNYGNVHGVPPETIQKMKDRWEKYDG